MGKFRVVDESGEYIVDVYPDGQVSVSDQFSEARVFGDVYWREYWENYRCEEVHTIEVGDIVEVVGKCKVQVTKVELGQLTGLLLDKDPSGRCSAITIDIW